MFLVRLVVDVEEVHEFHVTRARDIREFFNLAMHMGYDFTCVSLDLDMEEKRV